MTDREKAEVLCWAAHLFGAEADEITYRWPPAEPAEQERAAQLYDERDRIAERAEALARVEKHGEAATQLWQGALQRFSGAE